MKWYTFLSIMQKIYMYKVFTYLSGPMTNELRTCTRTEVTTPRTSTPRFFSS